MGSDSAEVTNPHIQLYLRHLPAITAALDAQQSAFYFNNALFLTSRLARSPGWSAREVDGGVVVDAGGEWSAVLPTTTSQEDFLQVIRQAIRPGCPALRVPAQMIPLLTDLDVYELWPDYVGNTAELQTLSGNKYKTLRQPILRAERTGRTEVIRLEAKHADDAVRVARLWYQERAPVLGKMYLETENLWLFQNLGWVLDNIPGAWGVGVKVDGVLEAVNLSCVLSQSEWCCHTERYRSGVLTYINQLAFREACRAVDAARYPWINDGSAEVLYVPGVANLAAFKQRMATFTRHVYGAWARE